MDSIYTGGNSDVQSLLARLGATSMKSKNDDSNNTNHHPPAVSSPIYDPHQSGPQPHRAADILSPNTSVLNTPVNENGINGRNPAANLLNLLRGAQPATAIATTAAATTTTTTNQQHKPVSAAELVANFGRKSSSIPIPSASVAAPVTSPTEMRSEPTQSPSANSQDFLLRLLSNSSSHLSPKLDSSQSKENLPVASTSSKQNVLPFSFSSSNPYRPAQSIFTATNPFEQFPSQTPKNSSPLPTIANTQVQPGPSVVPSRETGTVADAVEDVGEKVDKQVEEAIAKLVNPKSDQFDTKKPIINNDDIPGSWDDEVEGSQSPSPVIIVYFAPKPFTTIEFIKTFDPTPSLPQDTILPCIKFKKDFNQLDRALVAATSRFIWYALKDEGFKFLDHESVKSQIVFSNNKERIFNISTSVSKPAEGQTAKSSAVLATGVNGSIFWAPFTFFDPAQRVDQKFIMPPLDLAEDPNSNSQLKTRVKTSSRHPDFFAYGRGKWIYLIRPFVASQSTYTNRKTDILDYKKYFEKEKYKISVGKAAKDFAFSPDDTVLATIDKVGKLKFWDVSFLLNRSEEIVGDSMKIKSSIMTLHTSFSDAEKAWPTTVMFFEKEKQFNAGYAARYVIVGTKQNHNIQLWDLSLCQKVAELNLPHSDESDGICSLSFSPRLGLLVVGHPTRNSIFIVSISPPKYELSPKSQLEYLTLVSAKDPSLSPIRSTVCIASIREYSLNSIGELRSLDISLDAPEDKDVPPREKDYVMTLVVYHAKGIFEMVVNKSHLGLSKDNKPLNPHIDAEDGKHVKLSTIIQPRQDISTNDEPSQTNGTRNKPEESSKSASDTNTAATTSTEKKKDRKKKTNEKVFILAADDNVARQANRTNRSDSSPSKNETINLVVNHEQQPRSINMEARLISTIERVMNERMTMVEKRLADDFRAAEATATSKENAFTRQISQSIPQAIEKSLNTTAMKAISEKLENFKESVTNTFDRTATSAFANAIKNALPREMEKVTGSLSSKLAQDQTFIRAVSSVVSKDVSMAVSKELLKLTQNLGPVIDTAINRSTTKTTGILESRLAEQLAAYEVRRQQDRVIITNLNDRVNGLNQAIRELVAEQLKFKNEVMTALAANSVEKTVGSVPETGAVSPVAAPAAQVTSPQELAVAQPNLAHVQIRQYMNEGEYEKAFLQWLQSPDQAELFDEVFIHFNPIALRDCSALVVLSVAAACSVTFDTNVKQRMGWLAFAQSLIDPSNSETVQIVPKLLDILYQRLSKAFNTLSEQQSDPDTVKFQSYIGDIARYNRQLQSIATA